MSWLDGVRALYDGYIAKAEQLEREKKPGDGLLGLSGGPKDDPCHDQFAAALEGLLREMVRQRPPSGDVRDVLAYIYTAALAHGEPKTVYWMFEAVHGMTVDAVGLLSEKDAQILRDAYVKSHHRWRMLPSQKKALAALDEARKRRF